MLRNRTARHTNKCKCSSCVKKRKSDAKDMRFVKSTFILMLIFMIIVI